MRGSAEIVLVNQRCWFVDNDVSAGTCVVGFTLLEALLEVCSLTLSSRRLSFKFFVLFYFICLYKGVS